MLHLIKNAIVYSAELPDHQHLAKHLEEAKFEPIDTHELSRISFVPNRTTGEMVTKFEGGLSFSVRIDEKVMPAAVIKARVSEAVADIERKEGRRLGIKERKRVADDVRLVIAASALVKTTVVDCFYADANKYLIVPATKSWAGRIVGKLVDVVGSVKTTTIYISDIKNGLTTRLKNYLSSVDGDAFGEFGIGDSVVIQGGGQTISYRMEDLSAGKVGIEDAIGKDMQVTSLSMNYDLASFRLTHQFHFKAIRFDEVEGEDEVDEPVYADHEWRLAASGQTFIMAAVIKSLCDLMGYKPPQDDQQQDAGQAEG